MILYIKISIIRLWTPPELGVRIKVTENVEYYSVTRAIKTIEEADVVLLMIDGVEGLSEQDKKIANQIVKKGKGVIIVLNKWDKLEKVPI